MPLIPLDLGKQSNPGFNPHAGVARLVNCYVSQAMDGEKTGYPILAADGLETFATLEGAEGGGRAAIVVGNTLYVLMGKTLFAVDGSGSATLIGAIPSTGHATMAVNRQQPYQQVSIVSDGLSYILQNNILSPVTDTDLPPSIASVFLDGYFLHAVSGAIGRYYATAIDEGTDIGALDFASAEANPDGLMGIGVRGRDLVLPGEKSTEFHQNNGAGDGTFPFSRQTAINIGCLAKRSIAAISIITKENVTDTLAWVATDQYGRYAGVIVLDGYGARKISTEALDRVIQADASPSAIRATSWVSRGHAFYALTGTAWTWVYDTATSAWHERTSAGGRWRCSVVIPFSGWLIGLDATSGILYRMSHDIYADGADDLVMTVQTPPVHAYPARLVFDEVWIDALPGVGLVGQEDETADESETVDGDGPLTADAGESQEHATVYPEIMMQHSADGRTWSTELRRQLGMAGQTQTRVYWRRLGTAGSHGRTFRFRVSAAVARGFLGAFWSGDKRAA